MARADPADVGTIEGIVHAYYDVINGPAGVPRQWRRDSRWWISSAVWDDERPGAEIPESWVGRERVP
jgi:hypothetical protein